MPSWVPGSIQIPMTLGTLTEGIPGATLLGPGGSPDVSPARDIRVLAAVYRSDRVQSGDLFCCLRGEKADGHDFAATAVEAGAGALLLERALPLPVPQILVDDARRGMAWAAAMLAGHPSRDLDVVGITGTNGKTTSAFLMQSVLQAAGRPCGLLGTVEVRVGGRVEPAERTTPESADLQALLARMRDAGDRACVMEVSSHALAQRRVAGVRFGAALFTNLTRDHLDYHEDVEDYFQAKRALFVRPEGDGENPQGACNLDDEYGRRLAAESGSLGFSVKNSDADVFCERLSMHARGFEARISTPRGSFEVTSPLRGGFNVSNVAGVVAVGEILGLDHADVAAGIAALAGVPGRFEPVDTGQSFQVIVDYAHTPDSLENVLHAARDLVGDGKLLVVFGCGGDRDTGKRPQMGRAARELADVAVVTSDNPRSEDPDAIIKEILAGAQTGAAELVVEEDRRAAIALAVGRARPGDLVLIAGKGHESGQERAGVVTPFDDRDVAREALGEL
jgi:UDP-N-acetylmuramoyl-L-alanyl-D-glutamate--2,6-diaminopimelate ligase